MVNNLLSAVKNYIIAQSANGQNINIGTFLTIYLSSGLFSSSHISIPSDQICPLYLQFKVHSAEPKLSYFGFTLFWTSPFPSTV